MIAESGGWFFIGQKIAHVLQEYKSTYINFWWGMTGISFDKIAGHDSYALKDDCFASIPGDNVRAES